MQHLSKLVWSCVVGFIGISVMANSLAESPKEYNSGKNRVELIELYTSEGCSSCPPADRWLSSLNSTQGLWSDYVPVAFHVDYWDYIGWKDRFAQRRFSQRQRRYAAEFGQSTVYTPGVRVAGYEWRDWRKAGAQINAPDRLQEVGELTVAIQTEGRFSASFNRVGGNGDQPQQLTVALLGQSLKTNVARGENRGRELQHDFVVLGLSTLSGRTEGSETVWEGTLPEASEPAPQYAFAAWVSEGASQKPIQAVGGLL